MGAETVAFISGALALIGFVTVWVRVGIHKGQSDNRLTVVEQRNVELEKKVESLRSDLRNFEVEVVRGISKLQTTVEFVLKGLDELKKEQKKRGDCDA